MVSGPLAVPFPKEVVSSSGIPSMMTSESSNVTPISKSPKEALATVFSGILNKVSIALIGVRKIWIDRYSFHLNSLSWNQVELRHVADS
jgi:hypothetical protein